MNEVEQRESGMVKWFNDSKGYGFIARETGEDVFVHFSAIKAVGFRTLREGTRVEFTLVETDKGFQASEVVIQNERIPSPVNLQGEANG